jgi:hypothetical protein
MPGTLELEVHEKTAPPGWDEDLRGAGGVVFHSEAWASYKVHEGGGEPLFCVWRDGGEPAGRALAIRRPPRSSRLGRLAGKVVFDAPPSGGAEGAEFLPSLSEWCRSADGVVEVTLGSYDVVGSWGPEELPQPRRRLEYVLPPGDEEAIWAHMRPKVRRTVRVAAKRDLVSRLAEGPEDMRAFAEVYGITQARLRRDKGFEPGSALDRESFAKALQVLTERGVGRLYLAERAGQLAAGALFAVFGGRAYMVFSGSTDEARRLGGPYFVLCEAACDMRRSEIPTINLGGSGGDAADPGSPEYGLYEFKTRMGATVEPRTSGTLLPRPLRAKLVGAARKVVRR